MIDHHSTTRATAQDTAQEGTALPRFEKPPVVEVAISVQFDELARFQITHFGLLWERLRDRYPITEYHPPLPSTVELFGVRGIQHAALSIETGLPTGRCWFLSEDKLRLIQIQPDRFVVNWRKLETDVDYPSYEVLRGTFQEELDLFLEFVNDQDLGEFDPVQCELTYINHLPEGRGWRTPSDLPNVLAPWSGKCSDTYLPEIEDARFSWQYRFDEQERPIGRLHVALQSGIRQSDGVSVLVLTLAGRGAPAGGEGAGGVLRSLDQVHEWIVRGFTALTTDHMHKIWERQT